MSASKSDVVIAIAGGGLGGVCAAIALGKAGYAVHIFEQAPQFSEIGAGVGMTPNSLRALRGISLEASRACEEVAVVAEDGSVLLQVLNWKDSEHKFDTFRTGGPSFAIARSQMLERLLPFLPSNVKTEFSSRITDAENVEATAERPTHVRLTITPSQKHRDPDYVGPTRTFEADVVIGCDGVKSVLRTCVGAKGLDGATGRTERYTGSYGYRGLVKADDAVLANGNGVSVPSLWFGPSKHLLAIPIGQGLINLFASVSDRSKDANERVWEGPWVKQVDRQQMLDDFSGWDQRPLNMLKLIEKPERWALHECLPLDRWTKGLITLLGDAAHASLPHNGAGAGQAIEDAYVLGELFRLPECTRETLPQFLLAYEAVRRPRASRQQVHSRESGELYEFDGPKGDDWEQMEQDMSSRWHWLWLHDLSEDVMKAKESLKAQGVLQSV